MAKSSYKAIPRARGRRKRLYHLAGGVDIRVGEKLGPLLQTIHLKGIISFYLQKCKLRSYFTDEEAEAQK